MIALCTSLKDALSFKYITGIDAYSFQSEAYIPKELLPNTMYLVQDNDERGYVYADKIKHLFDIKVIIPINKDVFEDLKKVNINDLKEHYKKQL